ncbi:MAG: hypothetical protein OXC92_05830 [Flavobacteriaceae bacterium]|nr:hypothetical protein [Flavobacteriaceae bacterium]
MPLSEILNPKMVQFLDSIKVEWKKLILCKTVAPDISDVKDNSHDLLVFYSPAVIHSLFENFPDVRQYKTVIAIYEPSTVQAVL